jgi:hypothetical protein
MSDTLLVNGWLSSVILDEAIPLVEAMAVSQRHQVAGHVPRGVSAQPARPRPVIPSM